MIATALVARAAYRGYFNLQYRNDDAQDSHGTPANSFSVSRKYTPRNYGEVKTRTPIERQKSLFWETSLIGQAFTEPHRLVDGPVPGRARRWS
jgi:hypothetical protein